MSTTLFPEPTIHAQPYFEELQQSISGTLSEAIANRLSVASQQCYATDISFVLHPNSPMVPTAYANFQYFELTHGQSWCSGGADLIPYSIFDEDARHVHSVWKRVYDRHDPMYYPTFKCCCDEYLFLKHRGATHSMGGTLFDYLKSDLVKLVTLVQDCGYGFLDAYVPIVERRSNDPWGEKEKACQLQGRIRYVKFIALFGRETLFGLETGTRTGSILLSLLLLVRWDYDERPVPELGAQKRLNALQYPNVLAEATTSLLH